MQGFFYLCCFSSCFSVQLAYNNKNRRNKMLKKLVASKEITLKALKSELKKKLLTSWVVQTKNCPNELKNREFVLCSISTIDGYDNPVNQYYLRPGTGRILYRQTNGNPAVYHPTLHKKSYLNILKRIDMCLLQFKKLRTDIKNRDFARAYGVVPKGLDAYMS
jgi:hypothetical protein